MNRRKTVTGLCLLTLEVVARWIGERATEETPGRPPTVTDLANIFLVRREDIRARLEVLQLHGLVTGVHGSEATLQITPAGFAALYGRGWMVVAAERAHPVRWEKVRVAP